MIRLEMLKKDIEDLNQLRNALIDVAMTFFFQNDFKAEKVVWQEIMKLETEIEEKQQLWRELLIKIHREALDDFNGID